MILHEFILKRNCLSLFIHLTYNVIHKMILKSGFTFKQFVQIIIMLERWSEGEKQINVEICWILYLIGFCICHNSFFKYWPKKFSISRLDSIINESRSCKNNIFSDVFKFLRTYIIGEFYYQNQNYLVI